MGAALHVLAAAGALLLVLTAREVPAQRAPVAAEGAPADSTRGARAAPVSAAESPAPEASTAPGDAFYRAQREIPVGTHWGIGYEFNLRFSVRERRIYYENFDTARELLNHLAFVRYGVEGTVGRPFIRVGVLDTARLGHGQILSWYDNTPHDAAVTKRGIEAGMNFGRSGFEFIASNLTRLEIVAARVYTKPLLGRAAGLLGEIQVAVSGATDFAPGAGYMHDWLPKDATVRSGRVDGVRYPRPTMYGGDVTVPLVRSDGFELGSYVDVARLRGGGHGGVLALLLTRRIRNSLLTAKYEHREVSDGYRAGYFDGFYERERYSLSEGPGAPDGIWSVGTRYRTILMAESGGPAAWIESRATMPNLMVWGFFVRQYENSRSGWLHLEADTRRIPRVSLHAWYDKWQIQGLGDLLRADNRMSLQGAAAVRVVRNINVLALRRWTFTPVDTDGTRRYVRQRYAEHRVTLRVPF
jgi:hypothetical protein